MQGKIKILRIITRLDTGGSSEDVVNICNILNKEKYEQVLVYGLSQNINYQISVKAYRIKQLVRKISPIKDIIAFWKIYRIIKKEKPDIVHTHSSKAGILGRWAAFILRTLNSKLRTIKIIHTPHGHVFYGYYGKLITAIFILIERITAIITDKLIALTDGEKNESVAFGVGKPNQWVIIPSGVEENLGFRVQGLVAKLRFAATNSELQTLDSELRTQLGVPQNATVVGTVARLEPVKGVKYFIDAIKIIFSSPKSYLLTPTYFLIVGDGSERKMLEKMVERYKLKDKVIFTGMREDVLKLISIMDIYVQPSLNEGMGKTIVMASMLGKPVVATRVQGIPSVVIDGETGILVPPKDSKKLAEAIFKLVEDKELRIKMGQNGKKWVSKIVDGYPQFSVERMIFLLEKLYTELVSIV